MLPERCRLALRGGPVGDNLGEPGQTGLEPLWEGERCKRPTPQQPSSEPAVPEEGEGGPAAGPEGNDQTGPRTWTRSRLRVPLH